MAPAVDTFSIGLDTDKIRQLRQAKEWTQEQAAQRAGLRGPARWNDIESGRRINVTIDTLERIAKALGVKARDLLK